MGRYFVCVALAASTLTLSVARVWGQETLRWKFKPGDVLRYRMQQDTQQRQIVAGQETKNTMQQTLEQTWKVKQVVGDGSAQIGITFDRMTAKYDLPGGALVVDTGKEPPQGDAGRLDAAMRGLVNREYAVTMTATGEITKVVVPPRADQPAGNEANNPAQAAVDVNEAAIRELLSNAALPLPAKPVKVGETWNHEQSNPGFKLKLTYTLAGPEQVEGKELDKIDITGEMSLEKPPAQDVQVQLAKQDIQGAAHFDAKHGRLADAQISQKTTLNIKAGQRSAQQEVQVMMTNRLVPEGAAAKQASTAK